MIDFPKVEQPRNPLYGKYRAICMDIHDPVAKGRIRVQCPTVFGEQWSDWCSPCMPAGSMMYPNEGDLVWIEFEGGNPAYPIWVGVWYKGLNEEEGHAPWQEFHPQPWKDKSGNEIDKAKIDHRKDKTPDKVEQEFFQHSYYDPCVMGFKLPSGASVRFSEEPGNEYLELITTGMQLFDGKAGVIRIDPDNIRIEHRGIGCYLQMGKDGIELVHPSKGIFIRGTNIDLNDDK